MTRILFLSLLLGGATTAQGDRLVLLGGDSLSLAPLPNGLPEVERSTISETCRELVYLDDGRLLGLRDIFGDGVFRWLLVEILDDGTVVDLRILESAEDASSFEQPLDLAVDADGRLFLLSWVPTGGGASNGYTRLVQLDPENGSTLSSRALEKDPWMLARAPSGLWALTPDGLERLDPDSGTFTFVQALDGAGQDGETDSTGTLWLYGEGVCSPPCFFFQRFDPGTGLLTSVSAQELNPFFVTFADLAIQRRCEGSPTTLCLQGGRFRVELGWRDAAGATGEGQLTRARSADSGVFWLFDPANWEVNVKVLDGCAQNGNFWVFASGSTDVELTLEVHDLERGVSKTYENPLGRPMETITDTSAFACE